MGMPALGLRSQDVNGAPEHARSTPMRKPCSFGVLRFRQPFDDPHRDVEPFGQVFHWYP